MDNALIIFVRNLEKGKVKKRLAKSIGDDKSLQVYKYLLEHTKNVAISCEYHLFVFYSNYIHIADVFDDHIFAKHLQEGNDLGEKMTNAFKKVFELGHKNICLIGSDCNELQAEILHEAFARLHSSDIVVGPSADGGYYLIGMNNLYPEIFANKDWGTASVLDDTLESIRVVNLTFAQLKQLNDIDTIDDLLQTDILTRLEEESL